jgi:hypothetical protein
MNAVHCRPMLAALTVAAGLALTTFLWPLLVMPRPVASMAEASEPTMH